MRRVLIALAVLTLLGVATGCGSEGTTKALPETVVGTLPKAAHEPVPPPLPKGDAAAGEAIFKQQCGACHTLAAAGTAGQVGPDLDQAKPDYELATTRVWFGKAQMPAFGKDGILAPQQVANVAAYVVKATGGTP